MRLMLVYARSGKNCLFCILPITRDDAGLATVMGHEVSCLANHGAQRMSALNSTIRSVGVAVATGGKSEQTQQIWGQAYGLVLSLSNASFSRNHETEADKIDYF
jgi:predicted Zn-dependent protease